MNVYKDLDQHYDFKLYDKRQHVSLIRGFFEYANLKMCLSPPVKYFTDRFQGGTPFVDLLCFCSVLCLLCLCARLFICALWSPAGKGLTSRLWCLL